MYNPSTHGVTPDVKVTSAVLAAQGDVESSSDEESSRDEECVLGLYILY